MPRAVIPTSRLLLLSAREEDLQADLESPEALGQRLGCRVAQGWPPEYFDERATRFTLERLREDPTRGSWGLYYIALWRVPAPRGPVAIGVCGFTDKPVDGTVEIGYSIMPRFRRRGYATEATAGLVQRAFEKGVRRVRAQTYPELAGSIAVLRKGGFRLIGPGMEERLVCYEIRRDGTEGDVLRTELLRLHLEERGLQELACGSQRLAPTRGSTSARRLSEILDEYGWPGLSLVREDGEFAAWSLIAGAEDSVDLQRRALSYLRAVAPEEAPEWQVRELERRLDG